MTDAIFVTGATGYVGGHFARALHQHGHIVIAGCRILPQHSDGMQWAAHGDLAAPHDLASVLKGCETVVHFAGHAHVPETPEGVAQAQRTNVTGSINLADACVLAGVKRLVFISSALVLSGSRAPDGKIAGNSPLAPQSAYAKSKADAELALTGVSKSTGLDVVIVRPPMVYGSRSPGNFQRLLRLTATGLPVPLGAATALKSFIYIDNLVDAIKTVMLCPEAANRSFLVSDNEVLSTAELVKAMARGLGRSVMLPRVPLSAFRLLGKLAGRQQDVERLFEPLYMDNAEVRAITGWQPQFTAAEGISRTAQAYMSAANDGPVK